MQGLSSDFKQFFLVKNNLLTCIHNDTDATDDYNRVIGIALLKAFSCAKNQADKSNSLKYNKLSKQKIADAEEIKQATAQSVQQAVKPQLWW